MVLDTLESLLLRQDVFLLALLCLFGGPLVPETYTVGSLALGTALSAVGGLFVGVRILYGVGLVVHTSYLGWRSGYADGRLE